MKLSNKEKSRLLNKYGDWAIITGASSGIGLELTFLLAEAGFSIIINARSLNDLEELKAELTSNWDIQVKIVDADVSESMGIEKIIAASTAVNVGLLILSAGYGTSGTFMDNPIQTEINMLRVNCEALLSLIHHFGQRFAKQKRGGIIALSSVVAFQGTPFASHYAATKAYVQTLAEGLAVELKPKGVDVLVAAPGPVESGFAERAHMKMSNSLKPSDVGIPILMALGRKTTVLPGILTKLLMYSLRTVPRWGKVKIMAKVMSGMTAHQRNK